MFVYGFYFLLAFESLNCLLKEFPVINDLIKYKNLRPANIYLFKVSTETLQKSVKYVQS